MYNAEKKNKKPRNVMNSDIANIVKSKLTNELNKICTIYCINSENIKSTITQLLHVLYHSFVDLT